MKRAASAVAALAASGCLTALGGWPLPASAQGVTRDPTAPAPVDQPPAAPMEAFAQMAPLVPSGVAVGRTVGSFGVSATGQANYTIPIWTPKGIAGLTPSLSLSYSSGRGDGMYGVGWSVVGFSAITRCSKTYGQDGFSADVLLTSADLYCLDGNKLRTFSGAYGSDGAQYQTEIADF